MIIRLSIYLHTVNEVSLPVNRPKPDRLYWKPTIQILPPFPFSFQILSITISLIFSLNHSPYHHQIYTIPLSYRFPQILIDWWSGLAHIDFVFGIAHQCRDTITTLFEMINEKRWLPYWSHRYIESSWRLYIHFERCTDSLPSTSEIEWLRT